MEKMVVYGPSTFDMVTVYEATAIEQADNAVGRYGELRVYYPPAVLWSDHPFCVLNADWVTPQQNEAATLFINFLTEQSRTGTCSSEIWVPPCGPIHQTRPGRFAL